MSYFTGEDQTTGNDQTTNQEAQHRTEDYVSKIVQEKGDQWNDPQALAKGYLNSQEYIKQLEQQTAELREDLGKKDYVEDLLKQLKEGQAQPTTGVPSQASDNSGTNTEGNTTSQVSEDNLKSLIEQTLTERDSKNTARQNLEQTDRKLQELFGTEAGKVMEERTKELGMSKERLQELAAESPTAFFKLIGEEVKREDNPITQGTVNTEAGFYNQATDKRNFQYYQKLRRENSRQYYSPKIQNQMLQDRMKLGDSFYN